MHGNSLKFVTSPCAEHNQGILDIITDALQESWVCVYNTHIQLNSPSA